MAASSEPADRDRLDELVESFAAGGYAPEGADTGEGHHGGGHHGGHDHGGGSVREFEHRGHTVRIVTSYEVTIDGEPWTEPIEVRPDGTVVAHDLPQYVVPSASDLVRAAIDQGYEVPDEVRAVVEEIDREER